MTLRRRGVPRSAFRRHKAAVCKELQLGMAGKGTPAIVAAERAGIAFRVHEYEHDPRAPSFGFEAVERLGLDPARVFKTLVADVDETLVVAVVPVAAQLDLRALGKRARMADPRRAERSTGFVMGGISPLGQRRPLPTILDESALAFETIYVSGGRRGLELELTPADLLAVTGGRSAAVASRR
jgi:Cys-tRNA(Pro)/Cys-tRNA(Cys) deacylase